MQQSKVKRDGTIMPSKEQICENYDNSSLPFPLKNIWHLDYCWKLTYTTWVHSFYLAVPLTMCHFIYTQMPDCWNYTRKTFPKLLLAINYTACVLLINTVNVSYSLAFEDYCHRQSHIYDVNKRTSHILKGLIQKTNEENKQTLKGQASKSLTPEQIMQDASKFKK